MTTTIKNKAKQILLPIIPPDTNLDQEVSLISDGILDSFSVLVFIAKIENEFSIEIDMENFETQNFQSLDSITNFITNSIKKNKQ